MDGMDTYNSFQNTMYCTCEELMESPDSQKITNAMANESHNNNNTQENQLDLFISALTNEKFSIQELPNIEINLKLRANEMNLESEIESETESLTLNIKKNIPMEKIKPIYNFNSKIRVKKLSKGYATKNLQLKLYDQEKNFINAL